MFCNNCGNQIGEGERFCSKCGTAIVIEKKADTCPRCHATVEEGAKFCNKCGASLTAPQKTVCHGCGKPLEEGEQFCKSCGKAVGGVKLTDQIVEGIGKISDGKIKLSKYFGSSADPFSSLRLKHMIIGWALALLAVFCLVIPVVAVEVPILSFFSDDESATIYNLFLQRKSPHGQRKLLALCQRRSHSVVKNKQKPPSISNAIAFWETRGCFLLLKDLPLSVPA